MKIPASPPPFDLNLLVSADFTAVGVRPIADQSGRYRHWDRLRRLKPPKGLTSEQWWMAIKLARSLMLKPLPLRDTNGEMFRYGTPDAALEMLHYIDTRAAGEVTIDELVTTPADRNRYIVNSLIEEAITSSQLEGAATTRAVAKEMLRTGRSPKDRSERMIANNYRAIQLVREVVGERLTPEMVCELQRVVAEGTLDDERLAGRIQRPTDERVCVVDVEGNVLHQPPPAKELPSRLQQMCEFANDGLPGGGFMHPVARAILLHFWLAYDHPFADGNGRTARALFYWSMLREGYWLSEYLSISRILRLAPARYGRAFLYTETDDNDTTYFLLFQLSVICRAIDDFYEYLARKVAETKDVEQLLRSSSAFNSRQLALLSHALRNPGHDYTFYGHQRSHGVVYQSARTDILDLEAQGLLTRRKVGRTWLFNAPPDLPQRLEE